MATSKIPEPSFIDPSRLYTLPGFRYASGISATRMRTARLQGIICPMLVVGKRKFVRGADAIVYIERLAEKLVEKALPDR